MVLIADASKDEELNSLNSDDGAPRRTMIVHNRHVYGRLCHLDYFHALLPRSRDRIPMRSNITTDPIAAIEARSNSHLLWDARNLLPLPAP